MLAVVKFPTRFKVPLLVHARFAPSTPAVKFVVLPASVVKSVAAAVASIVPPVQLSVPPDAMVIAPAPVNVPPLMVVTPLKMEGPARVKSPADKVKLASLVSVLAVCPAVVTNTVPAPEPM